MPTLRHSPFDQALVDSAVRHGCVAPAFTRDTHPREWAAWEYRASKVVAISRTVDDLGAAIDDADAHAGLAMVERASSGFSLFARLTGSLFGPPSEGRRS